MQSQRMLESIKFVGGGSPPQSYSSLTNVAQYLSMKLYGRVVFRIDTGAWAAGTAAVTLAQATAVAGTGTKALAFAEMWVNTVAAPDTFTQTAVVANTFVLDTAALTYLIEVDANQLDNANSFDCVAVIVASPGANADFYNIST